MRIVTITFTALIISEILNIITTIHKLNRYILGSQIITLFVYWLSLQFLSNYLETAVIDQDFIWKVCVIVGVSWTPIYIARCIRQKCAPTEEDKITNWFHKLYLLSIVNFIFLSVNSKLYLFINQYQIYISLLYFIF